MNGPGTTQRRLFLAAAAAAALAAGLGYYVLFRWSDQSLERSLAYPGLGSVPSLVHMLAISWLAFALLGQARAWLVSALLLLLALAAEVSFGFYDPHDLQASVLGWLLASLTAGYCLRRATQRTFVAGTSTVAAGLLLLSGLLVSGSYCGLGCDPGQSSANARPVYLSYQALRGALSVDAPRPLGEIQRVYIYQSAVFLNRRNEGIHVLDNTDPRNPVNLAFITLPGNTELSIRGSFLYADSYVDLVTIDISDPNNVREVDRELDIFPYDEYQNIPDDIYFDYDTVDPSRGVVVAYERID